MTRMQRELPASILRAARAWALRLRLGGDGADRAAFESWCRADARHLRAYRDVAATLDLVGSAHAAGTLRGDAVEAAPRRRFAPYAVAASLLLLLAAGWTGRQLLAGRYDTEGGEMRSLTLEDGSIVHMNGATRLRVAYDDAERTIRLDEGEAMFEVAKNPARPFRVYAGTQVIEAVGTAFDVTAGRSGVDVAVREGIVKVTASVADAAAPVTLLHRGEAVQIAPDAPRAAPRTVAPEQIGNWRRGELIFQSVAFARVTEALSRRYGARFVVEDAALARTPVSIVLSARTKEGAIDLLEQAMGVRAVRRGRDTILFVPVAER